MKKIVVLLLVCFAAVAISGCAVDRNAIYDDDAKIAKSADTHYASMSVYSLDGDALFMTARSFAGAKTLWRYAAESDGDVTFTYSLESGEGGRAKLVLITPDDEVIVLAENADGAGTEASQSKTVSLQAGTSRIKIVGYDAQSLRLTLSADAGELSSK